MSLFLAILEQEDKEFMETNTIYRYNDGTNLQYFTKKELIEIIEHLEEKTPKNNLEDRIKALEEKMKAPIYFSRPCTCITCRNSIK